MLLKSIFIAQIIPAAVPVEVIAPVVPFPVVVVIGLSHRAPSEVILTAVIVVPLKVNCDPAANVK